MFFFVCFVVWRTNTGQAIYLLFIVVQTVVIGQLLSLRNLETPLPIYPSAGHVSACSMSYMDILNVEWPQNHIRVKFNVTAYCMAPMESRLRNYVMLLYDQGRTMAGSSQTWMMSIWSALVLCLYMYDTMVDSFWDQVDIFLWKHNYKVVEIKVSFVTFYRDIYGDVSP